jgi:hypothetical protein
MAMQPRRPLEHARDARRSVKHSHLFHWIRLLQSGGREPVVLVLEELPEGSSRHFVGLIERMYIDSLRRIGHRLTNVAEGGFGGSCGGHTLETRAAISKALSGRIVSDETRRRVGIASASRIMTPEWRAKISASLTGVKISPEALAKRFGTKRALGAVHSDESKAQQRAKMLGRVHTKETRAKMVAAQVARWAKRKANAGGTRTEDSDPSGIHPPASS